MSEDESSALWQTLVYAGLMALVIFTTVTLWAHVNALLLLGLPVLYFMTQSEWERYKGFKLRRVKESENS
jgi:hypothetical protein